MLLHYIHNTLLKNTSKKVPQIISLKRIWDQAPSCAFTDLIFFKGIWYCVFRESDAHQAGQDGIIRLIKSKDGDTWDSAAVFSQKGIDLRDPKLSITPDGKLMLLMGGTVYEGKKYVTRQPRVTFSDDGMTWSEPILILEPHEWLWRLTWHEGKAYGVSYRQSDPKVIKRRWIITLFESNDGINYTKITGWQVIHYPNETTLRFLKSGEMVALVRREKDRQASALIGTSKKPFKRWKWNSSGLYFGGPNFLVLDDGKMLAGGRILLKTPYGMQEKTTLAKMTLTSLDPILVLPSGGDTSYPGMVVHDGVLWMSYYSTHEGSTAIYLARIRN